MSASSMILIVPTLKTLVRSSWRSAMTHRACVWSGLTEHVMEAQRMRPIISSLWGTQIRQALEELVKPPVAPAERRYAAYLHETQVPRHTCLCGHLAVPIN